MIPIQSSKLSAYSIWNNEQISPEKNIQKTTQTQPNKSSSLNVAPDTQTLPTTDSIKSNNGVIFEKSAPSIQTASAYDKTGHVYNQQKISELKASVDSKLQGLKDSVKSMLENQGLKYQDVLSQLSSPDNSDKSSQFIKIDDATRASAQAEISEDGFWGVKQTSSRIVDFAKAISGEDKSKLDILKSAIKDGFDSAKDYFGGNLPAISQETYDSVITSLDNWANENVLVQ